MTEKLEIYKCSICGNVVQVLLEGAGELVCCSEVMEKLTPKQNEADELSEKHIPVIEAGETGNFVKLKYHPMVPEHYIQFIEVYPKNKNCLYLKYFNPSDKAELDISHFNEALEALELCNLHGLWSNKND